MKLSLHTIFELSKKQIIAWCFVGLIILCVALALELSQQFHQDKRFFHDQTHKFIHQQNIQQKQSDTVLSALSEYYTAQVIKSQTDFKLFANGLLNKDTKQRVIGLALITPRNKKQLLESSQFEKGYESFLISNTQLFEEQTNNLQHAFLAVTSITPLTPKNSIYLSEDLFSIPEVVSKFTASIKSNQTQSIILTNRLSEQLQTLSFQPIFLNSPDHLNHAQRLKQVRGIVFIIEPTKDILLHNLNQHFSLETLSISFKVTPDLSLENIPVLTNKVSRSFLDNFVQPKFTFKTPLLQGHTTKKLVVTQPWTVNDLNTTALIVTGLLTLFGYLTLTTIIITIVRYTQNLRQMQNRLSQILETSQDAVIITDENGLILDWNPEAKLLFGYSKAEALNQPIISLIFPEDTLSSTQVSHDSSINFFADSLNLTSFNGEAQKTEITLRNQKGTLITTEVATSFLNVRNTIEVSLFIKDITYQRSTEEAMTKMAFFDPLTQLENRTFFKTAVEKIITKTPDKKFALFFMDLDGFKQVNDTLGHSVGDELLKVVAKRIQNALRESGEGNHICRFGGDEFVLMLDQMDEVKAAQISLRLLNQIERMIKIQNDELQVSASIGIALYPQHGENVDTLLRHADTAMYCSKDLGKNTYSIYNDAMEEDLAERILIEKHLRNAIQKNELTLAYQPQINLRTGKVIGVEALIRWNNPVLGFIPPDKFIPIAEETQLIINIGEWIAQTCINQLKTWKHTPFSHFHIAMNVSGVQLEHPHFLEYVNKLMSNADIHKHLLEIELTERTVMNNADDNIHRFNQIRAKGFGLSVDDFGTGYSSLSYLKKFPLSILKIDKSFVDGIPQDEEDISIATAILNLAHSLNMQVVAEGVETQDQLQYLQQLDCNFAQGYFISRPLFIKDLEVWLQRNQANFYQSEYKQLAIHTDA